MNRDSGRLNPREPVETDRIRAIRCRCPQTPDMPSTALRGPCQSPPSQESCPLCAIHARASHWVRGHCRPTPDPTSYSYDQSYHPPDYRGRHRSGLHAYNAPRYQYSLPQSPTHRTPKPRLQPCQSGQYYFAPRWAQSSARQYFQSAQPIAGDDGRAAHQFRQNSTTR